MPENPGFQTPELATLSGHFCLKHLVNARVCVFHIDFLVALFLRLRVGFTPPSQLAAPSRLSFRQIISHEPERGLKIIRSLMRWLFGACLFGCLLFSTFAQREETRKFPCAVSDQQCAFEAAINHRVRLEPFWKDAFIRPIEARIGPAPAALIELQTLANIWEKVPDKPRAPQLSAAMVKDVREAFDELPSRIKALLANKLAGIYLIEGLGSTGYTVSIVNPDSKKERAGLIILDAAVLSIQTANSWATWKENTPFISNPAFELKAEIEEAAQDNRKNAIQYIMLHELAHVLSIGGSIHPPWTLQPNTIQDATKFLFFGQSWQIDKAKNRYLSQFDARFTHRKDVVYYLRPQLHADRMLGTYAQLEKTNFPTLYAATQPGDDFAESFVTYVHTVVMKRPFSIKLYQNGFLLKDFRICWDEPRCAGKRKIIEGLLAEK
jgi:hypothetical protein